MGRNRYFAQKEGLRKEGYSATMLMIGPSTFLEDEDEGCFFLRNEDFHTKGTFYHIITAAKHLPMSFQT